MKPEELAYVEHRLSKAKQTLQERRKAALQRITRRRKHTKLGAGATDTVILLREDRAR